MQCSSPDEWPMARLELTGVQTDGLFLSSPLRVGVTGEKQESALCGTHALNNLLQGPYFSEVDMAGVAAALDDRERALMAEGDAAGGGGVDSAAYLSFMAADSSNVDESGNFSIEVLSACLRNFNLECVNMASPACAGARAAPLAQDAFLCNLHAHWLALRKLDGRWWNLNSLQTDNDGWGPTPISDFFLDTLLHSLQERRWSIFVVSGSFPPTDTAADVRGRGRWFDSEEVVAHARLVAAGGGGASKKQKLEHAAAAARLMLPGGAAAGDPQLAQALALSMASTPSGGSETLPPQLRQAPRAAASPSSDDFDADLRRALAASLEDQRPAPAAAASINRSAIATPASAVSGAPAAASAAASTTPASASAPVAAATTAPSGSMAAMTPREAAAAAAIKRAAAAAAAAAATTAAAAAAAAPAGTSTPSSSSAPTPATTVSGSDSAICAPLSGAAVAVTAPQCAASATGAVAAGATSLASDDVAADADEDEDEREQLRLAMELSMQQ